jgi:hypothetical protein
MAHYNKMARDFTPCDTDLEDQGNCWQDVEGYWWYDSGTYIAPEDKWGAAHRRMAARGLVARLVRP